MDEGRKNMAKVIARAWTDDTFRKKLHSHPHAALAEAGLKVPAEHKIKVMEDSADTTHVVIPRRPKHLTAEQLSGSQVHADVCKFFC
jgi:hypothetical protein